MPGEKPLPSCWVLANLADMRPFPWHFRLFSPDALHPFWRPKAAVPESDMRAEILDVHLKRNSGNLAFLVYQGNSAIVGPGHHALVRGLGADAPSVTPSRQIQICRSEITAARGLRPWRRSGGA